MRKQRLKADFNGLFGNILCLSHEDYCLDQNGQKVFLSSGMRITAYDEDTNEKGERDDLIASGVVGPSPDWLQCRGSRWILRIDEKGVRNESEV
jgi:hypothetical protein